MHEQTNEIWRVEEVADFLKMKPAGNGGTMSVCLPQCEAISSS
jgi:hypothetical protein